MASSSNVNSKGRKPIKLEKMANESSLQVTFSKRRKGLFKKAYELTILTGVEVAVIVFSPGGKVYSFGHPTVENVTDRFLTGIPQPLNPTQQEVQTNRNKDVALINASIDTKRNLLEIEKKRGEALDSMLAEKGVQQWIARNVEEQSLPQLQQSIVALQNLGGVLEREMNTRALQGQQNYNVPANRYNYSGGEGELPPLSVGITYDGSGSGSGSGSRLPVLSGSTAYADELGGSNTHGFCQFPIGPSGYAVGGSGGVVPSPAGLGFYGSGSDARELIGGPSSSVGWSLNAGSSSIGGSGWQYNAGPRSFIGGDGSILPNTDGASSSGVGNGGGTSNTDGARSSGV